MGENNRIFLPLVILVSKIILTCESANTQANNITNSIVLRRETNIVDLLKCNDSSLKTGQIYYISSAPYFGPFVIDKEDYDEEYNFTLVTRFKNGPLECPMSLQKVSSQFLSLNEEEEFTSGHAIYRHGWLLKYYEDVWESIPPNRYCISELEKDGNFIVQYCQSDCKNEPCIRKCCYADQVCDLRVSSTTCECADSGPKKWTSTVNRNLSAAKQYSFIHPSLNLEDCETLHFTLSESSSKLDAFSRNEFQIDENGSVYFRRILDGRWINLEEKVYCIDGAMHSNASLVDQGLFSGDPSDMVLSICGKRSEVTTVTEYRNLVVYAIFVPFATVFIILTIIVYTLTWSEQNAHGYSVFSYLTTLFCLYTVLVLSNLPFLSHPETHPITCGFIAAAIHFFYLSSTCWLTSVSFDVFRKFQKMNSPRVRSKGLRRFTLYAIFSFGYPLIQVGVCAILDALYRDVLQKNVMFIIPDYGHGGLGCNMSNDGITFYLYIPISFFLACNMGFFVATILIMKHYKKSIREAFNGIYSNGSPKVNHSFGIYARLFIIMGIFWITQIISWFVLLDLNEREEESQYLGARTVFFITDALTIFQSVVIFYIFVCKKNVFVNLWNLQPWLRPFLSLFIRGRCCTNPIGDLRTINSRPNSGCQTNFTSLGGRSGLESRKPSKEGVSKESDALSGSQSKIARTLSAEKDGSGSSSLEYNVVDDLAQVNEVSTRFSGEGKMQSIEETEETNI